MTKFFKIIRINERYFFILCCLIYITIMVFDVFWDYKSGVPLEHMIHELGAMMIALTFLVMQILSLEEKNRTIRLKGETLSQVLTKNKELKVRLDQLKNDFRSLVESQFNVWDLSESEKEISFYILRGLSMKEIAELRQSSEQTIRQQAVLRPAVVPKTFFRVRPFEVQEAPFSLLPFLWY